MAIVRGMSALNIFVTAVTQATEGPKKPMNFLHCQFAIVLFTLIQWLHDFRLAGIYPKDGNEQLPASVYAIQLLLIGSY